MNPLPNVRRVIAAALLASVATAQEKADERVEPKMGVPAGKVLEWTSPQGQPYWYRVPKNLSAQKPAKLILMLHGSNMKWGWAFWNYPIIGGRFRTDDIIIAPEGVTPGGGPGIFNFIQGKPDGEQLVALIELFKKRFPIDRVYLYGHSQGAFFCYWFAGEHPELVDGIVAHAGNVLSVKHTPLAKQKLAVGILHGKADAVVGVECAYRTEKVYKDEGYKNVRLYVVEGLTEQSGHWPLPIQVGEMLAWLDQVTAAGPADAVAAALALLAAPAPDIVALADAVERAEGILKKAKPKEKDAALEAKVATLKELVADAAKRHLEALKAEAAVADPKLPFGAWAAHFAAVDAAFDAQPAWTEGLKALRAAAAKHAKPVDKTIKDLSATEKPAFAAGVKTWQENFLAPRRGELELVLERIAAKPPKGVDADDVGAYRKLADERGAADRKGREAARATTATAIKAFREAHPELVPAPPADAAPEPR